MNQNTNASLRPGSSIDDPSPNNSPKRSKKQLKIKPSSVAMYFGAFAMIVAVVSVGYFNAQDALGEETVANVAVVSKDVNLSIDDVVASRVAADVAMTANSPVYDSVSNFALSALLRSEFNQNTGVENSKPQILDVIIENKSVNNYVVQSGDTVATLSSKFGIKDTTIKWANNLTSNYLTVGRSLKILPIDGVLYTVKSGDTADSIANKYKIDSTLLLSYNDLELTGLVANTQIILPAGDLPVNERPGYVSPSTYWYRRVYGATGSSLEYLSIPTRGSWDAVNDVIKSYIPSINSLHDSSEGNGMVNGQCTWWAWERRKALGRPLPAGRLGNAEAWSASLGGIYSYKVDTIPKVGAVFQNSGNLGHVGIVESIDYDSSGNPLSFKTSEMNYGYSYTVVSRTIQASDFDKFNYIHDRS